MARLEVPLQEVTLWQTGDLVLRAWLDLSLKDAAGNWHEVRFRVDTGSDMNSLSAAVAKSLGLPMQQHGLLVPVTSATGTVPVVIRPGFLRIRVVNLSPVEHFSPCHFLGDPNTPLAVASATFPHGLLTLTGVVDRLNISFNADPKPGAPHGVMIVEER